ncbi:Cation-independent mannose-6-phosphate receptor CI-MPR [Dimargaris cristalligena]|uniref:Autophagy-related protein 27 n=1 Tax=Dimargaris cristalligena TaxID=215637 RepID=A0A4V1J5P0_9FUNG|nr:Cation-independent mannose-6-phosphate receptor CI-MPR [Dimargaris cristalligena]RKP39729.1 mannose-6-phosphate receptor binding domain-containing protein [Dimargaris cristalligena]|eukprot:RKP39729.1 mannose-6-phosphate receptor binding domain-containing protein [Dimargaris cristalligena]
MHFPSLPAGQTLAASLLLALSATPRATAHDEAHQCTLKDPNSENYYNLRALRHATSGEDDWEVEPFNSGYQFRLNVCHALTGDTSKLRNARQTAALAMRDDQVWSLGQASHDLRVRGDRLVLKYADGDRCEVPGGAGTKSDYYRTSVLSLVCDKNVRGLGKPEFVDQVDSCAYFFEWRTPVACPTSEPSDSSAGGTFFVAIFILVAIYMFFGVLYNRLTKQARGLEQIPHYHLWKGGFEFVKDMTQIILASIIGYFQNRRTARNSRYQHIGESDANTLIDDDF